MDVRDVHSDLKVGGRTGRYPSETIAGALLGVAVYGCYTTLFACVLDRLRRRDPIHWFLKTAAFLGYGFSTATIVIFLYAVGNQIDLAHASPFLRLSYAVNWLYYLNMLLADAVQLWRCYLVWGRSRNVILPLIPLYLITLLVDGVHYILWPFSEQPGFAAKLGHNFHGILSTIGGGASVVLNITVTLLISYKIRQNAKRLRDAFGANRYVTYYDQLVALIVEAGLLYSLLSAISLALSACTWLVGTRGQEGFTVIRPLTVLLPGMYPTGILLYAVSSHSRQMHTTLPNTTVRLTTRRNSNAHHQRHPLRVMVTRQVASAGDADLPSSPPPPLPPLSSSVSSTISSSGKKGAEGLDVVRSPESYYSANTTATSDFTDVKKEDGLEDEDEDDLDRHGYERKERKSVTIDIEGGLSISSKGEKEPKGLR